MKKIFNAAIVYCFDNMNQFKMFSHSYNSIKDEDMDILLIVNEPLSKNEILLNFIEDKNIKLIIQKEKRIKGMFYWLLSPLLSNYDYYIQLDNDTIIANLKLKDLIEKYQNKLKRKTFLGIKSFAWRNNVNKKVIKLYRKSQIDFYTKVNKYINTGVVLINGNNVRNRLSEKSYGIDHLISFFEDTKRNKFRTTDQEYLHSFWWKEIGFISIKFNLRTHILYDLKRYSNNRDIIIHYNLHSYMNEKWSKFDIINKIKELSKEEFMEEISEFWASSVDRKYSKKKSYKKNISRLYNTILENLQN